jgi:hypothetical protein
MVLVVVVLLRLLLLLLLVGRLRGRSLVRRGAAPTGAPPTTSSLVGPKRPHATPSLATPSATPFAPAAGTTQRLGPPKWVL